MVDGIHSLLFKETFISFKKNIYFSVKLEKTFNELKYVLLFFKYIFKFPRFLINYGSHTIRLQSYSRIFRPNKFYEQSNVFFKLVQFFFKTQIKLQMNRSSIIAVERKFQSFRKHAYS